MTNETETALRAYIAEIERGREYLAETAARSEADLLAEIERLKEKDKERLHHIAELMRENEALKAQAFELSEALRSLYDEQNGAPLADREPQWRDAYRVAGLTLKKYGK